MINKRNWLAILTLFCLSGFFGTAARAEGMPLPWPFPWAKECPINWEGMQGRYSLTDSDENQQLDLKITVVEHLNYKLVRVSRYGADGLLIADGFVWVAENQKTIRLWLFPLRKGDTPTFAVLKLYYRTSVASCTEDMLIPILTLDQVDDVHHTQSQYRLIKAGNPKN